MRALQPAVRRWRTRPGFLHRPYPDNLLPDNPNEINKVREREAAAQGRA
jgi:hypothetical protein